MRTVKDPDIRKQEILYGAAAVFLKKGYDKTTISDIAKELGISQGLCYRYFSSKEEIYDAVIEFYAALIAARNIENRPAQQSIGQWIEGIPCRIEGMLTAEEETVPFYPLFHGDGNRKMHEALCLKICEKLLHYVTRVLTDAQACGETTPCDPKQTAIFGLYGTMGLLMTGGPDVASAIQTHWRRLLCL